MWQKEKYDPILNTRGAAPTGVGSHTRTLVRSFQLEDVQTKKEKNRRCKFTVDNLPKQSEP